MKKRYLISYDLNAPGKDYRALIDALRQAGARQVLKSQWVAELSDTDTLTITKQILPLIDGNDQVLVVEFDLHRIAGTIDVIKIVRNE